MENVEEEELPHVQWCGDSATVLRTEDWLDFRNDIDVDASEEHLLRGVRKNIAPKNDQTGKISVKAPKRVQQASRTEATENRNDHAFLIDAEENLIRIR